jgi:acetylornithine deacetylase/succinyl-diaminopimelate desuccinylase-like protein
MPTEMACPSAAQADEEVADLCHALLRLDTNVASSDERTAAEWVASLVAEVGLDPVIVEPQPRRTNVFVRLRGHDQTRPALLVHGHLDVVPADPADWSVHPFGGEVRDGMLWGRGAVDMKDMVAMMLAVLRDRARGGRPPARDVIFAFLADEEMGGYAGARWIAEHRRDLLDGCDEAVGEVGGFSLTVREGLRAYLVQTAEKGISWMTLTARGDTAHGSMLVDQNAVVTLAAAVGRLGAYRFPVVLDDDAVTLLRNLCDLTGETWDPADPERVLERLGGMATMLGASLRHTANPTRFTAGYQANVVPGRAEATVDCRFLPGRFDEALAMVRRLVGDDVEVVADGSNDGVRAPAQGRLLDAMRASLQAEEPDALLLPYTMCGSTDAKHFSRAGLHCYGFSPLRLPPELDFPALFHGIDERVPLDALAFGARTLDRLLDLA